MNLLFAVLALVLGLLFLFRPSFFYQSKLLTPEQIARNNRICKCGGILFVVVGTALVLMALFWK
jgi:hypothetical protein